MIKNMPLISVAREVSRGVQIVTQLYKKSSNAIEYRTEKLDLQFGTPSYLNILPKNKLKKNSIIL